MAWTTMLTMGALAMAALPTAAQTPTVTKLDYPTAHVSDHTDVYFGTSVADPYRWMEEVDSPEVKRWIDAENKLTQSFLADVSSRDQVHARLMVLNDFERVSAPARESGRLFFTRNSGLQNQSVLYWQEGSNGQAKILLDPNTLRADGTVALETSAVSHDGKLLAYSLAEAGSDMQTIHVKEVASGKELPDLVEWVKFSSISWLKDGSGFFYSSYGVPRNEAERAEALKRVGSFHKVYLHKLGTEQTADIVVFERPDDKEMLSSGDVTEDGHWLVVGQSKGHTNAITLKDLTRPGWDHIGGATIPLAPVADAIYNVIDTRGHEAWVFTNKDAPKGKVVKVDLEHPQQTNWQTIVPESANSIDSAVTAGDTLVITYLVDAKSEVEVHALDGKLTRKVRLPGIGAAHVNAAHHDDADTFFTFTNYTTPPTIYRLDLKSAEASVYRAPKLRFNPDDFETKEVFATSKDGTRVPLFITHKKGTPLDGNAPTILYGYGGFNISLGPAYSASRLAWLEMGGTYAEAILRGGGEYGEAWHEAGTKLHKQNVFDDFIGCAQYLIANKYTSPAKLAINGGSNGGLLVGAVELQRPELFGAVLAQVGVMDMLRFDKFTIGYAWKSDYGSPSTNEDEFRAILKYSPVHNVHAGTHYPPTMILTADHDDRVFPAHSFKFAAAMQAAAEKTPGSAPVLIRVETRAGHGGGMPLSKQLDVTADMYAFLVKELKMPDAGKNQSQIR
jgi:prolyl oligopeptidase